MNKERQSVLILGSGGREDALAWKLRQSPDVGDLYIAPGNGGSGRFENTKRVNLDPNKPSEVVSAACDLGIDFVVVGPEEPMVKGGVIDELEKNNILGYGPSKEAAQLEGSKAFAVRFMERWGIPHPKSAIFDNFSSANSFLNHPPAWLQNGVVVKADGLCAGKGVFVCDTFDEGRLALERIMVKEEFGEAGKTVIIQERLRGFEVSAMAIVDGKRYSMLPYTEDHKQVYDEDRGPNTGGMGVVAPHPLVTPELAQKIENQNIRPAILGAAKEGMQFRGTLYPAIMVVNGIPYVLEFNVRFGDPEIEGALPLLSDGDGDRDFFKVIKSAAEGQLNFEGRYPVKEGFCVVVTLASGGYPGKYEKGKVINGLDKISEGESVVIFHAGTKKREDGQFETNGGRVLMVAGLGNTLSQAREKVYKVIGEEGIYFDNMYYRSDIGARRR